VSGPHDPVPEVPGVEEVIRALTAEGDATELTGRQSAVAMFRAARDGASGFRSPDLDTAPIPRPAQPRRGRGRRRRLTTLGAAAAAVVMACAGMTAAAYAQILPASLQNIAHRVLSPIGVPSAPPAATGLLPVPGSVTPNVPSGRPTVLPSPLASPRASCPCPTAGPNADVTAQLRADRLRVEADGKVVLTGQVAVKGSPDAGADVKLLEQLSASPGAWDVIATGLTSRAGDVTFAVPHVPVNTRFLLAGTGDLASLMSNQVAVTVTPRLVVRHPTRRGLVVTAGPAMTGDPVTLQELQGGAWVTVATQPLGGDLSATFTVSPPGAYRFLLPATTTHAAGVSRPVMVAAPPATPRPTTTPQATAAPRMTPTRGAP